MSRYTGSPKYERNAELPVVDYGPREIVGQRERENSRLTAAQVPAGDCGLHLVYGLDPQPIQTVDHLDGWVVLAVAMDLIDHDPWDDDLKSPLPEDLE